jgi:glycosyltransferase involved in cell wall biosynthesis
LKKRKVLVMVDWYAPGFKAGGPIRSAVNFADQLENELDIYILTTDRDLNEPSPYEGIETDKWIQRNAHHVYYASPNNLKWEKLKEIIVTIKPDVIYLNSMFSKYFTVYPLLMKRMGLLNARMVLAPRGMLKASALQHKSGKKKIFLSLFQILGLSNDILFHATDDTEEKDIKSIFGSAIALFKTGNLPGKQKSFKPPTHKTPGSLKIVFVGRIHPIKNLDFLLRAIQGITGEVELTVIATLEDRDYWEHCQSLIQNLPPNIQVKTIIDLPHDKIEEIILSNHIFALPTKGENFGHAIFEALAAGRPVLISNQTPWHRMVESNAGWDLLIENEDLFKDRIQQMVQMDIETLTTWCRGAWDYANKYLNHSDIKQSYLKQFS